MTAEGMTRFVDSRETLGNPCCVSLTSETSGLRCASGWVDLVLQAVAVVTNRQTTTVSVNLIPRMEALSMKADRFRVKFDRREAKDVINRTCSAAESLLQSLH